MGQLHIFESLGIRPGAAAVAARFMWKKRGAAEHRADLLALARRAAACASEVARLPVGAERQRAMDAGVAAADAVMKIWPLCGMELLLAACADLASGG